ncbi:MAG TPA: hypothetical protein VFC78_17745 [Tepidisphaeraceae bacterium]|nr:hypothetical protein [Tepidisphaeraceae bacterium]
MIVLLAGLIYSPWWILHRAQDRFAAAVAQRRARGERVLVEDFRQTPIPDEQNAAVYLKRAIQEMKLPHWEEMDEFKDALVGRTPLTPELEQAIARMIADNAPALNFAHLASGFPDADWKVRLVTPVYDTVKLPHLNELYELNQFLDVFIMDSHRRGDDSAAIGALRDLLGENRAMEHQPLEVSHLAALRPVAVAGDRCMLISPDLRLTTSKADPHARDGMIPARRQDVMDLIAEFLDEASLRMGIMENWQYGRMEMADRLIYGAPGASIIGRWRVYDQATLILRIYDIGVKARIASDWPIATQFFKEFPAGAPSLHDATESFESSQEGKTKVEFNLRTERRVAAIALALRLYAVDHDNHFPDRLDQLVPAYLHAVPADPFAANGRPLNYLPGKKPAIYSVGQDGVDNHGARGTGSQWNGPDAVFVLGYPDFPAKESAPKARRNPFDATRRAPPVSRPASTKRAIHDTLN